MEMRESSDAEDKTYLFKTKIQTIYIYIGAQATWRAAVN